MLAQPAEDRCHLDRLFAGVLLRQVQHHRAAQVGEVAFEVGRAVGGDEQEGGVLVLVLQAVLKRGPGLADAAEAVDGVLARDGGDVRRLVDQHAAELLEELVAPLEQ